MYVIFDEFSCLSEALQLVFCLSHCRSLLFQLFVAMLHVSYEGKGNIISLWQQHRFANSAGTHYMKEVCVDVFPFSEFLHP